MKKTMRRLGVIAAAALGVAAATTVPAHAAYPNVPGWEFPAHMAPTGTLCFETGGGKVLGPAITAAAAGWNKTDATVVARASCTGFPRRNVVKFVAYYSSATNPRGYVTECAMFVPGHYTWTYARGMWTWLPDTPTVKVNYSALAVKQCMNTTAKKYQMIAHETGHYLGLSHAVGITVMTSDVNGRYSSPTTYDIARINTRY